ncbi:alpha-aminoadipate reductase [Mytilinidion resinicola]|uniref:Alpha-aminoadipate reductase n=1 Tax=Mytilinidion resinicola TaxID=574789 RepID=A0A6A6YJZ2_9PEZI|nr:alpha-aminoadipate reductase [Mytilinidion resinicola]KAF2808878.1 alpha-aminoadipate reductase [Mytilinidion resinicola]
MATKSEPVLPDPTADLYWSDFKGSIFDIFGRNAQGQYAERTCVVETASSSSPQREFTYKQIYRASAILATHFVERGIQRGDVVMIFAHRGVDLVVAIMAALAAGATFSVLDPLYPPDRQCIYLEVSQPRALVVIDKATQEAGPLSEQVRSYISEHLDLRTEVPGLRLADDGALVGGQVNGQDCLDEQQKLDTFTPVVVGPDSTPTLSFTSGSEGRPKGVRGRHFSLTHYFPWMAERFGLSDNDRFTMLSGIAHDPIQRDIFTPLFLGAQLLVPSKEDIQHEKLAEWMRKYKPTVTHLTPAMGQILVGGAAAIFESLHHSFFVGDLLIKRDCRRLQELAPNVRIVNMYGTTETQRAVSYYELPSRNDSPDFLDTMPEVIPAGRGMNNVQLLVVDREDRTKICKVGQSGEIYVRAGGLAEEYLGLPDLTSEKFVKNWFVDNEKWVKEDNAKAADSPTPWREYWKGPRDRLYRSGDLGYYDEHGNVHCSGRVDSQVKIRGFRIELGEIDSHLAAHPLVRENVTLLKRDAYEEPTLVSYIVPEMKRWYQWLEDHGRIDDSTDTSMVGMLKRFKFLRDDVREHLKKKLPAYAVPSVLVPLSRFPLNPNGKIDRPALPFPEPGQLAAAGARRPSQLGKALTPTEKAVAEIWANLIRGVNPESIGGSDSFFDLGGHSIIAQQMLMAVRKKWRDIDVPMSTIFQYPTLRGFSANVDQALDPVGLRLDVGEAVDDDPEDEDYSADARDLSKQLIEKFEARNLDPTQEHTVFLTGATGFLGAFILQDLLSRKSPTIKVVALVRAKDGEAALSRVTDICQAYGIWDVWSNNWKSRLECLPGDLEKPNFGLAPDVWNRLADAVDVVIHNGALVHWVLPYSRLRSPNVLSTMTILSLCATGKAKQLGFVSSTSVLDNEHYIKVSEQSIAEGGAGVSEADDLEGSRKGLGSGYGQSKWAAEYLVRAAGKRGLKGCIIRPGYVTGDPEKGTTNTDDFLVRMLKGSIQIGVSIDMNNTVNMVPVTHVARVVVATSFYPPIEPLGVAQVTSHPRLTFNQFTVALAAYGVKKVPYKEWKQKLDDYIRDGKEEHALLPLYHFVTGDLPSDTRAPELDDANAAKALTLDAKWTGQDVSKGAAVELQTVKLYLAFLVEVGFLPQSTQGNLPLVRLGETQKRLLAKLGGRSGK